MRVDTRDVWVVIPMFNEAQTISTVVSDLRTAFDHVVCIDDGSDDGCLELARVAGAHVLRHAVNLGQGAALQTGFDFVLRQDGARWVVTFDADGQHLTRDAVAMVKAGRESELDAVLASRFRGRTEQMPRTRRALLRMAVRFSRRSTGLDLTDTHNGLRVISRRTLRLIQLRQPRMAYASELERLLGELEVRWTEVPSTVVYSEYSRAKGQRNSNAINILFDLALARLRATP